jgi:cold shock CspA family protein
VQTTVKKWFREKDFGFLANGEGPDIMVRKDDLLNCQFLKVGVTVEFECHPEKRGLTAKKVKLQHQNKNNQPNNRGGGNGGNRGNGGQQGYGRNNDKPFRFGVMT